MGRTARNLASCIGLHKHTDPCDIIRAPVTTIQNTKEELKQVESKRVALESNHTKLQADFKGLKKRCTRLQSKYDLALRKIKKLYSESWRVLAKSWARF
jgi:phage shock protein A